MHYRLLYFVIFLLLATIIPTHGQDLSCSSPFRDVQPLKLDIKPVESQRTSRTVMTWYTDSHCFLIGSTTGLWLHDIDDVENPQQLIDTSGIAITHVAVNPKNLSIAFSVASEPVIYLVNVTGTTTTLEAEQPIITQITFSPDGTFIAVASSKNDQEGWGFYDALVQIWDVTTQSQTALLMSDTGAITGIFFNQDNDRLLTDGFRSGYMGRDVDYWDISRESVVWNYDDLLGGLEKWSVQDPLLITQAIMNGDRIAFGGLNGYRDYDEFNGFGIDVWDAVSRQRTMQIEVNNRDYTDDTNYLASITFSSEGSILASANANGTIRLWTIPDGTKLSEFNMQNTPVYQISFSPDNRFLAVLSDKAINIWNLDEAKNIPH